MSYVPLGETVLVLLVVAAVFTRLFYYRIERARRKLKGGDSLGGRK